MMSRVLRTGAAVALCSCGYGAMSHTLHVESSAGGSFRASGIVGAPDTAAAADDAYALATRESAAHDLPCPNESVHVESGRSAHFVADGCGQRAVYECSWRPTPSTLGRYESVCRMVLVNRFAMPRDPMPLHRR